MNLGFEIPKPQLEINGIYGTPKAVAKQDTKLWKYQQEILAQHRYNLHSRVANFKTGQSSASELKGFLRNLTCKMHVGYWSALIEMYDDVNKLPPTILTGFFVLGGWQNEGDNAEPAGAPEDLLTQLRDYYATCVAESLRCKVEAATDKIDAQIRLADHLRNSPAFYLEDMAAVDLKTVIGKRQHELTVSIETSLLFLKKRVFLFGSWADLTEFMRSYRIVQNRFRYDVGQYYWGWYPSKN